MADWLNSDFLTPLILTVSVAVAFASFLSTRAAHKKRVAYDHLFQIVANETFLRSEEIFILAATVKERSGDEWKAETFLKGGTRAWPLSFVALELGEVENFIKNRGDTVSDKDAQKIFKIWRRWRKNIITYVGQYELLSISIVHGIIDENIAKAHVGDVLVDRYEKAQVFINPIRSQYGGDNEYYAYFQAVAKNWKKDSLPGPEGIFWSVARTIRGRPKLYRKLPDKLRRMRKERGAGAESADA